MSATLGRLSTEELVSRFVEIAIRQDQAIFRDDNAAFNRLFDRMDAVEQELKRRGGDQRRALMPLYSHPNMQVRLMAAKSTLAAAPEQARRMLEAIADSGWQPQAGDAGMCLWSLDQGVFIPT